MKEYPKWFDHHPYYPRLIQRYKRKATFIISKDDPLVQPLFQMIDAMDKPHAMKMGLILVQSTIDDVFIHTPYFEPIQFGLTMGQKWLTHDITMTIMRPIILHIHGLTKQCADPFLNRHIHAVGQALSTLHCQDHLKGWYLYSFAAWFYHDSFHFHPLKWIEQHMDQIKANQATIQTTSVKTIDQTKRIDI